MYESIYELYLAYRDKLIDDDFINKVYELMILKEPYLSYCINNFNIIDYVIDPKTKKKILCYGNFNYDTKHINIYREMINNKEVPKKNIFCIETIRHEIEHAKNVLKNIEDRNDIETKILRPSMRLYDKYYDLLENEDDNKIKIAEMKSLFSENYDYNPDERIVEIRAWKYIINLLRNQRESSDLNYALRNLYINYSRGYHNNQYYFDCPTYIFLINTCQIDDLKDLNMSVSNKEYSFDTRLLYGLPLNNDEFHKVISKKSSLLK